MKKNIFTRILAIALVAVSVMTIAIPAMASTTHVYVGWTTVSLDHPGTVAPCIYSGMSASTTLICNLSEVDTVQVKADTGSIYWIRCKYGSYEGYIACQYIDFTDATFRKTFFNNHNLQQGFKGEPVRNLQLFLKKLGYYNIKIDDLFGSGTKKAVENFQNVQGLTIDGIAGSATSAEIRHESQY